MEDVDVLLIHPPYHRRAGSGVIPPIGLAYIAASLIARGRSVSLLDCCLDCGSQSPKGLDHFRSFLRHKLGTFRAPICIGVGPSTTPALRSMYVLYEELRRHFPGVPIVYGGPFASMESQAPIFFDLLGATALVRGEGEDIFPLLVDALEEGNEGLPLAGVQWTAGVPTQVALVRDVNALPFPARHLLENHRYRPSLRRNIFEGPITAIFLSRGCPYHCAFCVSPLLRGNRVARRDLSNLFDEMNECITQYSIDGFIFYDDCLFLKSKKLDQQVQSFCTSLRASVGKVRWEMELRCDAVATLSRESLLALHAAGCMQINMGIEKASDQHLKNMNKRLTTEQIIAACDNVKQIVPQMRLAGTFILGGPGETLADIDQTMNFAKSLNIDFAHFYPLELYPGTPLFDVAFGTEAPTAWAYRMLEDDDNFWGEIRLETEELPGQVLIEVAQKAYNEFYQRPEWLDRFVATTSDTVRIPGLKIVDRWCVDRFHLTTEEADNDLLMA